MNLNAKLSMLTGESSIADSDLDLMGVQDARPAPNGPPKPAKPEPEKEEVLDFDLGELSIDAFLDESSKSSKRRKSEGSGSKKDDPFANLFVGLEPEDELPIGSKYRTGNRELDEATARARRLLEQADLIRADNFDSFLDDEEAFTAEEDAEMRSQLVAMGRKYARDNAASRESSEITKAYADTEKRLNDLFLEVSSEKASVQKDIERMRVPGRGGKMLSDMLEVKSTLHNTQLSIIKEMNAMKKTIFDLKAKEAAKKEAENAGGNDINANTLQSIFSSARNGLVDSMGGYGRVSGAEDDDEFTVVDNSDSDDEIQRKYFSDAKNQTQSDGDLFLKYEDRGVEMVLIVNEDYKPQSIIAEDKDGVMIPDYPIPTNLSELDFDIDQIAKSATDNFNRNYHVRVDA